MGNKSKCDGGLRVQLPERGDLVRVKWEDVRNMRDAGGPSFSLARPRETSKMIVTDTRMRKQFVRPDMRVIWNSNKLGPRKGSLQHLS